MVVCGASSLGGFALAVGYFVYLLRYIWRVLEHFSGSTSGQFRLRLQLQLHRRLLLSATTSLTPRATNCNPCKHDLRCSPADWIPLTVFVQRSRTFPARHSLCQPLSSTLDFSSSESNNVPRSPSLIYCPSDHASCPVNRVNVLYRIFYILLETVVSSVIADDTYRCH